MALLHDLAFPTISFDESDIRRCLPGSFEKGHSYHREGAVRDLRAADTVIHYDPWWNPAVEDQATDRAHRIGQDKPVFVYKLVAQGTVEERMLQLQQRKKVLAAGIYDAASGSGAGLEAGDIERLFEPLG